tara:strand:- start:2 stop:472 length:471 start_codon:yes stop_codon:yes gene_type:complete
MSSVQKTLNPKYISMDNSHVKKVLDIEKESYGYPWSEKIFLDCLEHKYLCRVLILDDILIGYLIGSIVQDECHIMNLCIKNNYRGYGYGKYLLTSLHNEIITLNCKLLFLECRPSNKLALNLYMSEGYNEVGIRKNYYPAANGYEDALILAKNVKE